VLATIFLHDRLTCLMERHGTSMLRLTRTRCRVGHSADCGQPAGSGAL